MLKILIADDSLVYRIILKKILRNIDGVEVCATVSNGKSALKEIFDKKPDIVLLDIEMPVMDGLSVMRELQKLKSTPDIIMCSSLTARGADITIQALELGACDFITKPLGEENSKESKIKLRDQLKNKLLAIKNKDINGQRESILDLDQTRASHLCFRKPQIVAIGISTGGPNALATLIPSLPKDFPVPVTIVQHMPPLFIESLADSLNRKSQVVVKVAEQAEYLRKGTVYLAPGNKQMKFFKRNHQMLIDINDDPPENFCKPAADYMFRSIASICGANSIGVIMTGMGRDGTAGLELMHQAGAFVIGQSESSCTIYGMPKAAYNANIVDKVLPLDKIAQRLVKMTTVTT